MEVDATSIGDAPSDKSSSWGIACRHDGRNFYVMGVEYYGSTYIGKYNDYEYTPLDDGISIVSTKASSETHHIRGDCVGDQLTLYVDGREVASATDSDFSSGQVGLHVSGNGDEPPGADISFDDFLASTPS